MNDEVLQAIKSHRMAAWNGKKQARWYARDVNNSFTFADIDLDTQVRITSSLVPQGSRVADIGCGTGALTLKLASLGYEVTGFDSSLPMLDQLRRRIKGLPVLLEQVDIFKLDASFGTFDAAVSRWVLPHFPNWGEIASAVGQVLRPGGIFVFDMIRKEHEEFASSPETWSSKRAEGEPRSGWSESSDPVREPTRETAGGIESVLKNAGFEVLGIYPFGLFAGNRLISSTLNPEELEKTSKAVDKLLGKSEALRTLITSLEASVTPHIPQHLLLRSLVVACRN